VTLVGSSEGHATGGKLNLRFPLPGCVGFPQTQPVLAFVKSETAHTQLKQPSPEVTGMFYCAFWS